MVKLKLVYSGLLQNGTQMQKHLKEKCITINFMCASYERPAITKIYSTSKAPDCKVYEVVRC